MQLKRFALIRRASFNIVVTHIKRYIACVGPDVLSKRAPFQCVLCLNNYPICAFTVTSVTLIVPTGHYM